MPRPGFVWLLGLSVFTVTWIRPADAVAEAKARLVYVRGDGADDCPEEVDLRLWVMARLGYDPFSPQASRVVLARVEEHSGQLGGTVELVDGQGKSTGRRELSSAHGRCQELARALALSISLVIDPERATTGPKPAEPAPSQPSLLTPVAAPRVRRPSRASRDESSSNWFTAAAVTSSVAMLPAVALGGLASAGLRARNLSVALEARGSMSFSQEVAPRGELSGALVGGGVAGCWHHAVLAWCATSLAGAQRLTGADVSRPSSRTGLYLGLGSRLELRTTMSAGLEVMVAAEGLFNLSRNRALLSGLEVWEAPLVSGSLMAGGTAHFL